MLAYLVLCSFVLATVVATADNSTLYRLPKSVYPESYDVLLLTNVSRGDFTYEGKVSIEFRVLNETNKIVLHADKLNVKKEQSVFKETTNDADVKIADQSYDNETQFFTLGFAENLKSGKYVLTLHFEGEVLDDVFGFYRSSYRANNQTRWIGATQFSPTFARRAFPCMDEPGFKATFQMHIGHYDNETVSSNTSPISQNQTSIPNYVITTFARTPKMPTYVLGWVIHDFNRTHSTDPRISLWSRHPNLTTSAMIREAPLIYTALENFMNQDNPVYKIEQLAVPDFYFSAMENWGLVTYRESNTEADLPVKYDQSALITIGHEFTHTWFGNLVTPDFWDHAWLKEGFANFFAYYAMGVVHEDWDAMDLFAVEVLQDGLLDDGATHDRTMNGKKVGSPASAKAALDFVTYKKGSSIVRMIADIVGEDVFKKALRSYLAERKFEAATPEDLYKQLDTALEGTSISETIPVSMSQIVESWANQPNYPVINVTRIDSQAFNFTQRVFLYNRTTQAAKNVSASGTWWVPLSVMIENLEGEKELSYVSTWIHPNHTLLIRSHDNKTKMGWYVVNPDQIGFYRVNYDPVNWKVLTDLLDSSQYKKVPKVARSALIDDAFNLARAGYRTYYLPLSLSEYLRREDEYEPWVAATRAFNLMHKKLRDRPEVHQDFQRYASNLISPIYMQLRTLECPEDSRIKKMQRNLVLSTACSLNLEDCVSRAKLIFDDWIDGENKTVPANVKSLVYRAGIVRGTNDDWTKLWNKLLKTNLHSEKAMIFDALAYSHDSENINKLIDFAIQPDSDIAKQYRIPIVRSIIEKSSKNIDTVLEYIQNNLENIVKLQKIDFVKGIISFIGEEITSSTQKNKLSTFVELKEMSQLVSSINDAIKATTNNLAWIERSADQIFKYLHPHQKNETMGCLTNFTRV